MDNKFLLKVTATEWINLANVCRVKIAESKVSVTFVGGEALNIAGAEAETARKRLQPYFVDIPA